MRRLAAKYGVQRERLYQISNGAPVGVKTAARILATVRAEDLALADRIEAELVSSWRDELRRLDQ